MGMNTAAVQRLYVAYFNRPADPLAIGDYEKMLPTDRVATQAELQELAEKFFSPSLEYQAKIDGLGNADIVNELYLNIFGRPADVDGLKFWAGALGDGSQTVASLALQLSYSAQGTDATVVAARIDAAIAFTNGLDTAEEILGYQGPAAIAAATAYLEQISGVLPTTVEAITAQKTAAIAGVDATIANVVAVGGPAGTSIELEVGFDDITGTNKNDTITGVLSTTASAKTLEDVDVIDGGDGRDTLEIVDATGGQALPTALAMTNVENVTTRSGGAVAVDLATAAGVVGVTSLSSTQSTTSTLNAGATTSINVSGASGAVTVTGGLNVSVSDSSDDDDITIGGAGTDAAAGTVTVTDSNQAAQLISVTGGTNVTVTATSAAATEDIDIAGATGAVAVTQNLNSTGAALDNTGAGKDINVNGGATVNVTINGNNTADATADAGALSMTDVIVLGDGKTTAVTVTGNDNNTTFSTAAKAAVAETAVVTFKAMTTGQTLEVATAGDATGLIFTASKNLTAEQVAQAFANLTDSDTQESGGPLANGVYTDALPTGWTSGAASGATVTFSAATGAADDIIFQGTATSPTQVKTAGTAAVAAAKSTNTVVFGDSNIQDNATAAITTVTLDGYASASMGINGGAADTKLDALTTLNLSNNTAGGDVAVATDATTLALNVDNITATANAVVNLDHDGNATADGSATVTDLTLASAGKASAFELQTDKLENLTINAAVALDIKTNAATSYANVELVTVDVNGAGAVDLGVVTASTALTSFDASGNTGGVTATIEADGATLTGTLTEYVFSEGADKITVSATTGTAADVKVTAGAGDDTVTLAGINTLGSTISGGAGTNTLSMAAADAETASGAITFETGIDSFSILGLGEVATTADHTVNLTNLDDISYVASANTADTAEVTVLTTDSTAATAVANGETLSLVVGGTTFTFTAAGGAADENSMLVGLAALIQADARVATAAVSGDANNATVTITGTAGQVLEVGTLTDSQAAITATNAITSSELFLTNMADGGTLALSAAGIGATVTMADATGGSDTFNIVTALTTADLNVGTVVVNAVETLNLNMTTEIKDDNLDGEISVGEATPEVATLGLIADAVTTVNVQGNSGLVLTAEATNVITAINAATLTGPLTATANGTAAMTITGGSGVNTLTAVGASDVLIGGAGKDVLTGADSTTLTGNGGADKFVVTIPTNVNSYSTITAVAAGDVIQLTAGESFVSAAVSLADTAVFQDYANAAVNQLATNDKDAGWFQYDGNTYVVINDNQADAVNADFENGQDAIIRITGLVDLSTASYNLTDGTLEIG